MEPDLDQLYTNAVTAAKSVTQYVLKGKWGNLHSKVKRGLVSDQLLYLVATDPSLQPHTGTLYQMLMADLEFR